MGNVLTRVVAVAAALPLALLSAQPASAGAPVACGSQVQGRVVLTQDLVCDGPGLVVTAPGTTIDLNGHTLRHAGGVSERGVHGIRVGEHADEQPEARVAGVSVRNGRITGYAVAVGSVLTEGLTVERITTDGGIASDSGEDLVLRRSSVAGLVHLTYHGSALLEGNRLHQVAVQGVGVRILRNVVRGEVSVSESRQVRIAGNRVIGGAGIRLWDYVGESVVEGNRITGTTHGVLLGGVVLEDDVVRNNDVRDSASAGIRVHHPQAVSGVLVEGNRVTGSGFRDVPDEHYGPSTEGIGVQVEHPQDRSGITLRRNRVSSSAGHGIHAPGVVDGGGNRASGSGLQPGCVGVTCTR